MYRHVRSCTCIGHVKLADFGVATCLASSISARDSLAGSAYWLAPEVVAKASPYATPHCTVGVGYSFKVDLWSLGITVLELGEGQPPLFPAAPLQVRGSVPSVRRCLRACVRACVCVNM